MSNYFDWSAWDIDWPTIWIAFWAFQFALIEYLTGGVIPTWEGEMVTDHLRPVFHAAPLTWWIALGVWLWLGFHMLWPAAEAAIQRTVGG